MPATIFQGNVVKALKNALQLGDQATVYSGNVDPSSVAQPGNPGDVFISTSQNTIYVKTDSGTSVNWTKQQPATLAHNHIYVGNSGGTPGDVPLSGDASIVDTGALTVQSVGGSSAANVHSAELLANAATNSNTPSAIVKRDSSGNFNAGTLSLSGLNMNGNPITNVSTPSNVSDAATKGYVDNLEAGFSWKNDTRSGTTGALPSYSYNNGASGVGATITGLSPGALPAQDGVSLSPGDRLLVKNETGLNQPYNGIYIVTQVGTGLLPFILTRATDLDEASEFPGATVSIGPDASTQAGFIYRQSTPDPITVGISNIVFIQFSIGIVYSFNNGLSLSGSAVNVLFDDSTIGLNGSNQLYVKNSGITNTQLAQMSNNTVKGNKSGITANPTDLSLGDVTEVTSAVLSISGGSKAIIGAGLSIQVLQSSGGQSGYLSSTDWSTFNNKQNALSFGNLTESTSSVLTISGGTGAVIGSGTSIQVKQSSGSQSGYLSSTDWNTFNNKQNATAGDIYLTSFTASDNQATPADITAFAFSNGSIRGFDSLVTITRNSTYANYKIRGIQKASSWELVQDFVGDTTGITFSITSAGQLQYTSSNTGFNATIKFRAIITTI